MILSEKRPAHVLGFITSLIRMLQYLLFIWRFPLFCSVQSPSVKLPGEPPMTGMLERGLVVSKYLSREKLPIGFEYGLLGLNGLRALLYIGIGCCTGAGGGG